MTGGKRKLAQLFTSQMKIDGSGTTIKRMLSGSVAITAGCITEATTNMNASYVSEVTIPDLSPCDMLMGTVWGMSGCVSFNGEVLAGDGQASVVTRFTGCADGDSDTITGVFRYIAFKL